MRLSRRKWSMARKHTIFIGALFHVAIAMFKLDSPMVDNVVPASYLELLSSTLQLPPAAARTWQWTLRDWGGLGFKRLAIDFSIHTSKSSSHVFHGKNLLPPPSPPTETKGVRLNLYVYTLAGQDSPRLPEEQLLPGLQDCGCFAQKLF